MVDVYKRQMYILSMYAAQVRGEIEESTLGNMLKEIVLLPEKVASILTDKERIQWFANKFASAHDVFFIGRGLDYAICQEGSLKMKEVSYVQMCIRDRFSSGDFYSSENHRLLDKPLFFPQTKILIPH